MSNENKNNHEFDFSAELSGKCRNCTSEAVTS